MLYMYLYISIVLFSLFIAVFFVLLACAALLSVFPSLILSPSLLLLTEAHTHTQTNSFTAVCIFETIQTPHAQPIAWSLLLWVFGRA